MLVQTRRTTLAVVLSILMLLLVLCGTALGATPVWVAPGNVYCLADLVGGACTSTGTMSAPTVGSSPAGDVAVGGFNGSRAQSSWRGAGLGNSFSEETGLYSPSLSCHISGYDCSTTGNIVFDDAGKGYAFVNGSDGTNTRAQVATKLPGGDWGVPVNISTEFINGNVAGATNGAGDQVAVWVATNSHLRYSTRLAGGAWTAPADIAASGFGPRPAINAARDIVVGYTAGGGTLIVGAYRPAGGAMTTTTLSAATNTVGMGGAGIDANGVATVAWQRENTAGVSDYVIQYASFSGGVWAPAAGNVAQNLTTPATTASQVGSVAVSRTGRTIVSFSKSTDLSNYKPSAAMRPAPGQPWVTTQFSSTNSMSVPAVGAGTNGHAVAAWTSGAANTVNAVSLRPTETTWSSVATLGGQTSASSRLELAVDGQGNAFVAWGDGSMRGFNGAGLDAGGHVSTERPSLPRARRVRRSRSR